MSQNLIRYSLRHLWKQRWQSFLLVLGILLGVAVAVAIDFANESSRKALQATTAQLSGSATHEITASGGKIPEADFVNLVRSGLIKRAAPIVEGYVEVETLDNQVMLLLGIDPFWDAAVRNYYGTDQHNSLIMLQGLNSPNQIFISSEVASLNGLVPSDHLILNYEGRSIDAQIAGLLEADDSLENQSLQGILLTDISAAQVMLGKISGLDRIELIVENEVQLKSIQSSLPTGLIIRSISEKNQQIENLVGAFQLNLTALSLLALVVGLFLIYNTMTFSVVQRRETIGIYRSLGLYRGEIFQMILFEAVVIGFIGTILGIAIGFLLGKQTVFLILRTINDLYFVTTVKTAQLSGSSILKGAGLGIMATMIVSLPPALEATQVSPRLAQLSSDYEQKTKRMLRILILIMFGAFVIALGLLFLPWFSHLWWAFAATFFVVLGFGIFSAVGMEAVLPAFAKIFSKSLGLISGMAVRIIHRSISRTAVAVASLMVAVSVTIGMTIMIESFRQTVLVWLSETLAGDVYVSVPNQFVNQSSVVIDQNLVNLLSNYEGSYQTDFLFTTSLFAGENPVQVNVVTNTLIEQERIFLEKESGVLWDKMLDGGIMVSEPLKNRLGLKLGDMLDLVTPDGKKSFKVIAIFNDYASNQGHLLMAQPVYEKIWGKMGVTAISYRMKPGITPGEAVRELNLLTENSEQKLLIRDNASLRKDVIQVFDQTFAVTNALRLIATIVSVIGILSAIILILIDRKQEFGLLKALGINQTDQRKLIFTQSALMGLFAGVFAVPTGIVISLILIYVINLRSFGWTIQLNITPWYLIQGVIIAVVSSLLGGIYPAYKFENSTALEVLRYE